MYRQTRTRKNSGSLAKGAGLVLVCVGIMVMLYPAFTSLYAQYSQTREAARLAQAEDPSPGPAGTPGTETDNPAIAKAPEEGLTRPERPNESPAPGATAPSPGTTPVAPGTATAEFKGARIEIPAIKVSATVVRGTTLASLAKGPGWYEESALPGEGNTAIAGHRTMYGAWFRNTDKLKTGDVVNIIYDGQVYEYRVEKVFPIANTDWSVIEPCGYPALTLTTCHPPGSAVQRLVVRAKLVAQSPVSAKGL